MERRHSLSPGYIVAEGTLPEGGDRSTRLLQIEQRAEHQARAVLLAGAYNSGE